MTDKHPHQLPIPQAAASDPRAREIGRIWAADGKQHVALATGLWDDPALWGMMLVDLAKHVANAYAQSGTHGHAEALARIRAGFDAEWGHATDVPDGRVGGV